MRDGDGLFKLNPLRDWLIGMPDEEVSALKRVTIEFEIQHHAEPLSPITVPTNNDYLRASALRFLGEKVFFSNLNSDGSLTLDFSVAKHKESGINPLLRVKKVLQKIEEGKVFDKRHYKNRPNVDLQSLIPDPKNKKYKSLFKMAGLFQKNYITSNYLLARCVTPNIRRVNNKLTKYTKKDYQNNKLRDDKRIQTRIRKLNKYFYPHYFISFNYDRCVLEPRKSS